MPDPLFTLRCLSIARALAREGKWGTPAGGIATFVWALLPCLEQLQDPTDADIAGLLQKCYQHKDGPMVLAMLSEGSVEGEEYWEQWSRYLYRMAVGADKLPPQIAEDLSQVACKELLRSLPRFRFESALKSFVFSIYLNCKNQWLRTPSTQSQMQALPVRTGEGEEPELTWPDDSAGPEELYAAAERIRLVRDVIRDTANDVDTAILCLTYFQARRNPQTGAPEAWSDDAIGARLGMAAANVRVRRFRALKRLSQSPTLKRVWDALRGQNAPDTTQGERIRGPDATHRVRGTEGTEAK